MENSRGVYFYCSEHSRQPLTKVDPQYGSSLDLYCVDCLTQSRDYTYIKSRLKSMMDFIHNASDYYKRNRPSSTNDFHSSNEFREILRARYPTVETLNHHIDIQKKEVNQTFDIIIKHFTQTLEKKREQALTTLNEYSKKLEQEYHSYERAFNKCFSTGSEEDLFPSERQLLSKFGKLRNTEELRNFIKELKDDMNESYTFTEEIQKQGLPIEEARRLHLKGLKDRLRSQARVRPEIFDSRFEIKRALELIDNFVSNSIDPFFKIKEREDFSEIAIPDRYFSHEGEASAFSKRIISEDLNKRSLILSDQQSSSRFGPLRYSGNSSRELAQSKVLYPSYGLGSATREYTAPPIDKYYTSEVKVRFNAQEYRSGLRSSPGISPPKQNTRLETYEGEDENILQASHILLIKSWLSKEYKSSKLRLIYKGATDGLNGVTFHEKCNRKGPTLTVVKSNSGHLFGGFLDVSWESSNKYLTSTSSWLFSLTLAEKYEMNEGLELHAAYDFSTCGPSFGQGDLYLTADFTSSINYSNRSTYKIPESKLFTGGLNFSVVDIEVYQIV